MILNSGTVYESHVARTNESMMHVFNTTRIAFCGTWYLPHSQVHNQRTVSIIMPGWITHERNGHLFTSGL